MEEASPSSIFMYPPIFPLKLKQLAIKRIQWKSLKGFQLQSVGSSNTDVLDLPCLIVLITGTSQSRQHVETSSILIESRKSPTKSLFDAGSSRISIFIVSTLVSLGCSGKITRIMRRTLVNSL
ncbi:hypothetical protein Tco_0682408 [Tanacetum coccineum]|uniref:Uncharacterized protein n=1 Tax=Tanacetum coccineum TaxID=301880 RepID=A0ABQ4XR32_9ASTR